jgi:hypothetical protein
VQSGILKEHGETQFVFSENHIFKTPSGAAMVILGRTSNGWKDWKDDQGRSLHEMKRSPESSDN